MQTQSTSKPSSEQRKARKRANALYYAANKEAHKMYFAEYRKLKKEEIQTTNARWYRENLESARWSSLKATAKSKGLLLSITKFDFVELTKKRCFYCGGRSSDRGYVGLDRVNSLLGYVLENVVPCCRRCNTMKNDMSISEWFDRMERIMKFSGR